jgi:hypothetical protein
LKPERADENRRHGVLTWSIGRRENYRADSTAIAAIVEGIAPDPVDVQDRHVVLRTATAVTQTTALFPAAGPGAWRLRLILDRSNAATAGNYEKAG